MFMNNNFNYVISEIVDYFELFGKTWGLSFLLNVGLFFLGSYAIFVMSKKIGTNCPWISFIPFVQSFALGRLAEKYIKKDGSKSAKFGIILLILNIIQSILLGVLVILTFISVFTIILNVEDAISNDLKVTLEMFSSFIPVLIVFFILFAVAVCYKVIYAVALWRVFVVFDYKNATLYTIISVIFSLISPIFLFVIRNNTPVFDFKSRAGYFEIEQV